MFRLLIVQVFDRAAGHDRRRARPAMRRIAAVLWSSARPRASWRPTVLVRKFHLYRFGVEEAMAVASVIFAVAAAVLAAVAVRGSSYSGDAPWLSALVVGAARRWRSFSISASSMPPLWRWCSRPAVPFLPGDNDTVHRLLSAAVLVLRLRDRRAESARKHGREFPGDNYAIIEAAAWIGIYLVINLPLSSWLSQRDDRHAVLLGHLRGHVATAHRRVVDRGARSPPPASRRQHRDGDRDAMTNKQYLGDRRGMPTIRSPLACC